MKVCVATHCTWTSIGSMLQAYGLKYALAQLGCESFIASDLPQRVEERKAPSSLKGTASMAYDALHRASRHLAFQRGVSFINEKLTVCTFENYAALCRADLSADAYLAGSDQIWHPEALKPLFFLAFADSRAKRISYAASMGVETIRPEKREEFRRLLGNIDTISVREAECAKSIAALSGKSVSVHIDPTFLCPQEHWRSLEMPYPMKGKYILIYTIYWDAALNKKMAALHRETGLPVVAVSSHLTRAYANRRLFDVGPEEFLWLLDHAEYVVTSSFHGLALSAIFNKKVSAVINPNAPSRLTNLLRTLSLPVLQIDQLDKCAEIDYAAVNEKILSEAQRGIQYLKDALGQ